MLATRLTGAGGGRRVCRPQRGVLARSRGALGWTPLPPPPSPTFTTAPGGPLPAAIAPRREGASSPSAFAAITPLAPFTSGGCGFSSTGVSAGPAAPGPRDAAPSFALHRIGGDGSCMFRAIVQGAQLATTGKPMALDSESKAALNLRLRVVQELRNRREEIAPFLPGIASDFDEYCRNMSDPMVWGGEPEMVMAVNVVQRPITVYHMQKGILAPIVTYGDHMLGSVQPINLLWSGAHYDLLVPRA